MADAASAFKTDGTGEVSPADAEALPIPLPKFIRCRPDGLHVDLAALDSPALFRSFVDRTFSAGMYFTGLDYPAMHRLLYGVETAAIAKGASLRFAAGVAVLMPERRRCYRSPKLAEGGREAEYLFEPVMVEKTVEEPVYGDTAADGSRAIVDRLLRTVSVREKLDLDEFIAAMWSEAVRFGIDVEAVRKAIVGDRVERVMIARTLLPAPGQDATVAEMTSSLHRNDTPRLLADGRIDLHHFQNRFPQVAKNTRLLRKVPRVSGKSGWDLAGNEIPSELPRDVDIVQVSGPGTRIDRTGDGEFVVADMSGFLNIDAASGTISISEKIIHLEGVGLHTTGNLTLDGDEYEEHGEVQELSKIEGKNMTFQADVFGKIASHGGRVVFKKNLNAGAVRNPLGSVVVEGNASRATIEAVGGEITLGHAEGCVIIGKKVRIEHAIQCDILADELRVEVAEGCALGAQRLHVGSASMRRDTGTTMSMLVPDLSAYTKQLEDLALKQSEYEAVIEASTREIEAVTSQPDVKSYSVLNARMRSNELRLTTEQSANWQKLLSRVLPVLRHLKSLNDELQGVRSACREVSAKMERLHQECKAMSAAIDCRVEFIAGDTVIRTLPVHLDAPPLHALGQRELRARLREASAGCTILFSGCEGEFVWTP